MDKLKVSKMGKMLIIILPSVEYRHKGLVSIKPKGRDTKIYLRIAKTGNKLIVIIPKHLHKFSRLCSAGPFLPKYHNYQNHTTPINSTSHE